MKEISCALQFPFLWVYRHLLIFIKLNKYAGICRLMPSRMRSWRGELILWIRQSSVAWLHWQLWTNTSCTKCLAIVRWKATMSYTVQMQSFFRKHSFRATAKRNGVWARSRCMTTATTQQNTNGINKKKQTQNGSRTNGRNKKQKQKQKNKFKQTNIHIYIYM